MTATRSIPWLRVFVEGVVIVGSILLALGVDSAWQAAQDRRLAAEVVSGLAQSFEENRTLLEVRMGRREQKLTATHELLLIVTDPSPTVSPDSVAAVLRQVRSLQGFQADDSRFRELIASGRMHLISSEELRVRLAGWEARYQDLTGVEDKATRHTEQAIGPWLRARIPVTGGPGRLDQVPPRRLMAADVQTLRGLEFENLLRDMFFYDRNAQDRAVRMLSFIDEILQLLAHELD